MFSLTLQERRVILFLISVALTGIGIDFLVKKYSRTKIIADFYQDIGKINLNSADKDTLMSISGIGEKLAVRILEYRSQKGGFHDLEELKNIKSITNYRYEKIKDSLCIK